MFIKKSSKRNRVNTDLKEFKKTKAVIHPIVPNIIEMPRPLFPGAHCTFPSKCIH
jgi:hypothetical protein